MTKPAGKTKVHLATDFSEPITLHWALSKNQAGEWSVIFSSLLSQEMMTFKNVLNIYKITVFLLHFFWLPYHVLLV